MRHAFTYLLLLACCVCAYATSIYEYDAPTPLPFQSHKILDSGGAYKGATYAPFDNTAPSEQSGYGPQRAPGKGGVRKSDGDDWNPDDFITGPDTPPGQQYPIGEPWVLAIFALLFAGVLALRKTKKS